MCNHHWKGIRLALTWSFAAHTVKHEILPSSFNSAAEEDAGIMRADLGSVVQCSFGHGTVLRGSAKVI